MLQFISDDGYRRMIGKRLNITEARHRLARRIFFGQRGELWQDYRAGMDDQLGALGLALNSVVLRNSLYLDRAAKQPAADGFPVPTACRPACHHCSSTISTSWAGTRSSVRRRPGAGPARALDRRERRAVAGWGTGQPADGEPTRMSAVATAAAAEGGLGALSWRAPPLESVRARDHRVPRELGRPNQEPVLPKGRAGFAYLKYCDFA
ncbi:Tn3 family transposase [Streptosporangium algeriense]|uniref:Tn3 family transposase n=1 Tax=Streptosporangium algeriense TaxID=1682748 RepID=A0ABW3DTX8_9ACTN